MEKFQDNTYSDEVTNFIADLGSTPGNPLSGFGVPDGGLAIPKALSPMTAAGAADMAAMYAEIGSSYTPTTSSAIPLDIPTDRFVDSIVNSESPIWDPRDAFSEFQAEPKNPTIYYRPDGTPKNDGWQGVFTNAHGGGVTEYSVGAMINPETDMPDFNIEPPEGVPWETLVKSGAAIDFPRLVPDSTPEELDFIVRMSDGQESSRSEKAYAIQDKALNFAIERRKQGLSPFFNGNLADKASF